MSVVIVSDSTCDLNPKEALSLGIELVPISVRFGSKVYKDGVDLSLSEFYDKLSGERELPTTEPPTSEAFAAVFRRNIDAGKKIICLTVSAKLSKTYDNAVVAASALGEGIRIIDSKTVSGGIGLLASGAAKLALEGEDLFSIVTV
jgi:DegV family protein with EDD domain